MPVSDHPVHNVQWIPVDQVEPNQYNPNSVATNEMRLLYLSIKNDGYTQPVVAIWDSQREKYIIVDGFHRWLIMKTYDDIRASTEGVLPVVVIEKDENDRMASTVRHNRARGQHSMDGMANMVYSMLENGWKDAEICEELGMEPDEIVRLKHVTGFSKLFADVEYGNAWETRRQIQYRTQYKQKGEVDSE